MMVAQEAVGALEVVGMLGSSCCNPAMSGGTDEKWIKGDIVGSCASEDNSHVMHAAEPKSLRKEYVEV
jgi:hypothetical protein